MAQTSGNKTRVLVVDDSTFMCKVLRGIINSDPRLEVVGEAHDGREAVVLAESLRPDVITMDIKMPYVDGLQAIEMIMSQHPRPIVMVTSEGSEGLSRGIDLGAIDFVPKPSGEIDFDVQGIREELTRKLKLAAKVRVIRTATRAKSVSANRVSTASSGVTRSAHGSAQFPIIVVAASTGGPAAITRVVSGLPSGLPAAVFLVLHMPATFTTQFIVQLAEIAALPVKEMRAAEIVQPGTIYLCPGSHHLRMSPAGNICLDPTQRAEGYRYRPSVDLALETVARYAGLFATGVILTGMGNDGAKGVQAVKKSGGYVIAQDEATSTIFGMPDEAIKTGSVDEVLPLQEIAAAIEKHISRLCKAVPAEVR